MEDNRFTSLWWPLPLINMEQPQTHMRTTPIVKPFPPPSPPHPSGLSQSSGLLHALKLHWSAVLHMVIYIFQCHCLVSSHPHLLPHDSTVCSLHLCLLAAVYIVSLLPPFQIPHVCVIILYWCFSFWLTHSVLEAPVSSTSSELTQMCSFL